MKKVSIASIVPGTTVRYECYDERGEMLLAAGTVVEQHHLDLMRRRNVFDLYMLVPAEKKTPAGSPKPAPPEPSPVEKKPPADVQPKAAETTDTAETVLRVTGEFDKIRREQLDALLKSPNALQLDFNLRRRHPPDRPVGVGFQSQLEHNVLTMRSAQYKNEVRALYRDMLDTLKEFLDTLFKGASVDSAPLRRDIDLLVKAFAADPDFILSLAALKPQGDDYLFSHMLNTCILALGTAAAAGYNREQTATIALGALLHDIGMPLVPREIREKSGKLSSREFMEIQKHPVMGILMLDKIRHLPEPVRYILYQSHERENGTGYPHQRLSDLIHRHAKIIQIADVFEALTSPRKHRAAYTPFEAMEMVVRMSQRGLLAGHFVKSMLTFLSLFPVGSVVELSDHRIGRVIHANPSMFHRPVVSILKTADGAVVSDRDVYQVDLSINQDVSVLRALPAKLPDDTDLMRGF